MNLTNWYKKKIPVFFTLCALTIILCTSLLNIEFGQLNNQKYNIFSIEFNYYGVDSDRIEQLITIPLEEKLVELEGLFELRSTSEYNKSYVSAYFEKKIDTTRIYLELRNIVDNLYNNLPQDVQKPRIYSSSANDKSVFTISISGNQDINEIRQWADKNLKKKFESIDGVSEVIITGGKQKEILVSFDADKTTSAGQNPAGFSSIIQDGNAVTPSSYITLNQEKKNIVFDTKLHSLDEIRNLPVKIGEGYTKLQYLAEIQETYRENDEYVRINGNECICIHIKSASNGNSIKISKGCKQLLQENSKSDISFNILYDNGQEQLKLLKNVLLALVQSFIFIILLVPFFYKSTRVTLNILLVMILDIIWTLGLLHLLNMNVNQNTISGITISLGLIADPVLIIGEVTETCTSENSFFDKINNYILSIIAAAVTTLLVLLPLYFLDSIIPGVKVIAITMTLMIINSIIISILFVPTFIYSKKQKINIIPERIFKAIEKKTYRFSFFCTLKSIKNSKKISLIYLIFVFLPVVLFFSNGRDISFNDQTSIIYCSVEYDPEIKGIYIDNSLNDFINEIKQLPEIKYVRTEARKGSADIDIGFYENKTTYKELSAKLSNYSDFITDGYLYIPGSTQKNNKKHLEIEIAVIGDDEKLCKEYAEKASQVLIKYNVADATVLNFKRAEQQISFIPQKQKLFINGISVQSLSTSLRWMLFGPVADKWLQDGTEQDIRIVGKNLHNTNLSTIENLHIPTGNSYQILPSLGTIKQNEGTGKLYRKDGRHAAFFTVEINNMSTDKALKKVKETLNTISLDKGYGFSFPKEIDSMNHNYKILIFVFFICIIFIFLILTAISEKPIKTVILISIIPVSCIFPLFLRLVTNTSLVLGDIIGLVVLAGISINNSIYIGESKKKNIHFKLREKIKSIMVTSFTTIISSIPLYIFCKDVFSKSLAFFMFFGVLNSLIVCLLMFCGFYKKTQKT